MKSGYPWEDEFPPTVPLRLEESGLPMLSMTKLRHLTSSLLYDINTKALYGHIDAPSLETLHLQHSHTAEWLMGSFTQRTLRIVKTLTTSIPAYTSSASNALARSGRLEHLIAFVWGWDESILRWLGFNPDSTSNTAPDVVLPRLQTLTINYMYPHQSQDEEIPIMTMEKQLRLFYKYRQDIRSPLKRIEVFDGGFIIVALDETSDCPLGMFHFGC